MRANSKECTARSEGNNTESSDNAPPGLAPISRILPCTRPPVERMFSISRARSTEYVNVSESSSRLTGSSERKSSLLRADEGIEFTLTPPSIVPKLKDERWETGKSPTNCASVN
jgi:hypothetical protein